MYAPPFDSLLKAVGHYRAEFEHSTEMTQFSAGLFKLLLQVALPVVILIKQVI